MATPRTTVITLRADERRRTLIERAADAAGKSRSEFVLDAAAREAANVLLDRLEVKLESRDFRQFGKVLDTAPKANLGLRKLLARRVPWDR